MTLEQDSKSEENCNLRPAKAGHSSNICLEGRTPPPAPHGRRLLTRDGRRPSRGKPARTRRSQTLAGAQLQQMFGFEWGKPDVFSTHQAGSGGL